MGFHSDTSAILNLLKHHTKTSVPDILTEEMLLGIGGGTGYGYFTFFYEKEDFSSLYLGTRALWESSESFISGTLKSLGFTPAVRQTKDRKAAFEKLDKQVSSGNPVIVAINEDVFRKKNISQSGYQIYGTVLDLDKTAGTVQIAIHQERPVEISIEELILGRDHLATRKIINQSIFLPETDAPGLSLQKIASAAKAGIETGIKSAHNPRMSNFGITALDRWKTALTSSNKASFSKIFYNTSHLVNALYYTYYWITQNSDGYALRHAYSAFLRTAGDMVDEPLLKEASALYRESGRIWKTIAEDSLSHKEFVLLKEKFQELKKFEQREDFDLGTYRELNSDLIELKAAASEQLRMTDSDRRDLFGHLADLVSEVKAMETSALANLQEALLSKRWEEYKS
ncbi:BtrH N-terminal domain-containing protein [Metabacillus sp. cB07]|uniref:BtrH N-terminal domain-containing protein n=1 Tax=Metabacillus sp. cB07 TaxID=2806989 RepID=UPI001939832C|nr:BtrH N-terminal domain-containing protein [Metabacillus sp. cB07]